MKKNIVIKIGGSLLFSDDRKIRSDYVSEFCDIIKNKKEFGSIVLVCGGGIIARDYIEILRKLGGNETLCDIIGIKISHLNCQLFLSCLNDYAYPKVPNSIEELSIATQFKKIILMGGLQPGQSTTSVALEVAEFINANRVIVLTDVSGIYDKDPKKHKDANLIKKMTYGKLKEILLNSFDKNQAKAGEYRIFDMVSFQILKRSNIEVMIMNGKDLSEFKKLWNGGKEFFGTLISN